MYLYTPRPVKTGLEGPRMLFLDRNLAAAGKARPAGSGMSGTLCVETPDTPSVPWTKGPPSQQEMMDHPTDTQTQWYAMRVFGNRIFRIKEEAEGLGAQTYLALRTESGASCPGERQRVQIVPSLLFVRWDLDRLNAFKQAHFSDLMIYRRADSTEPAPVDEAQMRMFMLVTSALDGRDIEFVGEHFDFKPGERVRVTGGPYAGAEGVIRRIKRDRKLLVAVNGIAVVAISHIPGAFLEKIESS